MALRLIFFVLAIGAVLAMPTSAMGQNANCSTCVDMEHPEVEDFWIHRISSATDNVRCNSPGHTTHDCNGDPDTEWDGTSCESHEPQCPSNFVLEEIGKSATVTAATALALLSKHSESVSYSARNNMLTVRDCGGNVVRDVPVTQWIDTVAVVLKIFAAVFPSISV